MPPLRERSEDIPLLARYFFEKTLIEMNIKGMTIEPEVLSYFTTKNWPGNVSEASRISGLSRVAIGKLSRRLGIDLRRFR